MPGISFLLNGKPAEVDADPATPLLWILRDTLALTATKFGCGAGLCGACTVHVDGEAARSCLTPLSAVAGKQVTTLEGLAPEMRARLEAVLTAEQAPQCGYCMPGQIMQAADLLRRNPRATRHQIRAAISGNLCRCGCYPRVEAALVRAANGGGR